MVVRMPIILLDPASNLHVRWRDSNCEAGEARLVQCHPLKCRLLPLWWQELIYMRNVHCVPYVCQAFDGLLVICTASL